ncbi:hypothetical protein GJ744_003815 [Endocarpon pusillum]|uniref:Uncharacterized protein n=1 Tax=Endocarpon pusillum TaxID=364733 RepID=A0A8H7AP52_9EURO|nr:hypothetical protein GJ744_003815 [Endocarpon pusillum]
MVDMFVARPPPGTVNIATPLLICSNVTELVETQGILDRLVAIEKIVVRQEEEEGTVSSAIERFLQSESTSCFHDELPRRAEDVRQGSEDIVQLLQVISGISSVASELQSRLLELQKSTVHHAPTIHVNKPAQAQNRPSTTPTREETEAARDKPETDEVRLEDLGQKLHTTSERRPQAPTAKSLTLRIIPQDEGAADESGPQDEPEAESAPATPVDERLLEKVSILSSASQDEGAAEGSGPWSEPEAESVPATPRIWMMLPKAVGAWNVVSSTLITLVPAITLGLHSTSVTGARNSQTFSLRRRGF